MKRSSGVLMPVFSLPSKYGIGDFGKEAYNFIDYLKTAGQFVWQILPLVQTSFGNSPYSSVSSESFNPYFISPDLLFEEGLLTEEELSELVYDSTLIDYENLYSQRHTMLRKAFSRFNKSNKSFKAFVKSKDGYDYALFMALKNQFEQKPFYEWDEEYKKRDSAFLDEFSKANEEEINFWQFIQFVAKKQWLNLKKYANKNGIKIMGDMPLYVALDSVDVWVNPTLYKLDENFMPKKVAGVPPDYFCADGQLWGNPVYDYSVHIKNDFNWWTNRLKKALKIYDYVRIDHFRGLDRYYEVDALAENARDGEWIDVPHDEFFKALHKKVNKRRIIAEDLGIIDDGVRDLLKDTGYPGMKILSFAFNGDKDNLYLPNRLEKNCICYTGTHDNDTLRGLVENFNEWDYNNFVNGVKETSKEMNVEICSESIDGYIKAVIEMGAKSEADLFILPWQDVLGLDSTYRINEPGTVKEQNWAVRFRGEDFLSEYALKLKELTQKYKR